MFEQSFCAFLLKTKRGILLPLAHKLHHKQESIAHTGDFDSPLPPALKSHTKTDTTLEDAQPISQHHVLDSLWAQPRHVGLHECNFVGVYLFHINQRTFSVHMQSLRMNFGELQREGVRYYLAENQLVLAVEQQEGVEMHYRSHLLSRRLNRVVQLRQQLVKGHLWRLQFVVRLELPLQRRLEDVIEQKGQFFGKARIGGELWALALEGSDGVSDEGAELRQLTEHGEL